jgi:hypothetical protein
MSARSWLSGGVCVLLVGLAGCSLPDSLRLSFWGKSEDNDASASGPYVIGTLEKSAQSVHFVLRDLGIDAVTQSEGDDRIVIHCATKMGTRFALILERGPTSSTGPPVGTPHTRIDFVWETTPDYRVRCQVLGALTALNSR